MKRPILYIIAGPNGAGKTTFAIKFLPKYAKCPHFVNADLIAKGISPFTPEIAAIKAGRILLEEIKELLEQRKSFGFETTLSGQTYISFFKEAKKRGYEIHLFFLWIPSVKLAIARIKDRVAKGGHNIPNPDVRRRFSRSINNFFILYLPLVDSWYLFDNSAEKPDLIANMAGGKVYIGDHQLYDKIRGRKIE